MSVTVPRSELSAIAWRHGMDYEISSDASVEWVRGMAAELRRAAQGSATSGELLTEASELDALADRYEAQHANAMWSHTSGANP